MQTENNRKMCKHIKDKDSYFFPTTPSALFQGKKSAKKNGGLVGTPNTVNTQQKAETL